MTTRGRAEGPFAVAELEAETGRMDCDEGARLDKEEEVVEMLGDEEKEVGWEWVNDEDDERMAPMAFATSRDEEVEGF